MNRDINLIGYLPNVLSEILEFKELMKAENPEIKLLFEKMDLVLDNCFIESLDGYGCSRWENMLKIQVKDTDDLQLRRLRIKAALNGDTPYTMRSLEQKLKTLCVEGNVFINYANDEYTLTVSMALHAKNQYEYIQKLLTEIVPANIMINVKLLYNTHLLLSELTHQQMKIYTHKNLREDVL